MRVIRNVIWGVGYGLAFAALFMAWAVIARIIGGADAFGEKGTTLLTVLALYLFGGVAAGGIVGLLRPIVRWRIGSVLVGIIAAEVIYGAGWIALNQPRDKGAAMLDWQSAIRTRLVRLAVLLCALSVLSASYACQRRTQRATFSPVAERCYRLAFIPAAFVDSVPSLSGQKLADLVFLAQAGFDSTWHLAFATDTGGASAWTGAKWRQSEGDSIDIVLPTEAGLVGAQLRLATLADTLTGRAWVFYDTPSKSQPEAKAFAIRRWCPYTAH